MIWDPSDHWDARVVEYSGWRLIWNYETLEPRAGVYVFADANLSVKYVGKAGPGTNHTKRHLYCMAGYSQVGRRG